MVTPAGPSDFVTMALGVGHDIAELGVRHNGRVTWVAEGANQLGTRRRFRTLDADLAGGTAGVGWFLARLAGASGDAELADLAGDAIASALDGVPSLGEAGRSGWYTGTSGVAWAALDAGFVLGREDLIGKGADLAEDVLRSDPGADVAGLALVGGCADVVAGQLALAHALGDRSRLTVSTAAGDRLAASVGVDDRCRRAPGLAQGSTGVALVAAAWVASVNGNGSHVGSGVDRNERLWFEPGVGWYARPGHGPMHAPAAIDGSWCGGAAGIGLARLAAHVGRSDPANLVDLADLGAAIECVRAGCLVDDGRDSSVCHGAAGGIELMLSAGVALGEPTHLAAARRAGQVLAQRRSIGAGAPVDHGPGGEQPSLMYGAAGVGLLMLRLADPTIAPTPALPPFLLPSRDS